MENTRIRLAALLEKKPPTKAAQIRNLWPEITAALERGHSLKAITECLAADGISISAHSLSAYLGRIRKNSAAAEKLPTRGQTDFGGNATPNLASKSTTVSVQAGPQRSRRPLANVQKRQKKSTGFDYRPELADPKDLI
jgi:hypothetical protein